MVPQTQVEVWEGVGSTRVVSQSLRLLQESLAEVHQYTEIELGIGVVRSIIAQAYHHPRVGSERRYFWLRFQSATHEAQNALLKLLEEPPPTTHFVLIVPSRIVLLPTVLSRVHVRALPNDSNSSAALPELLTVPVTEALSCISDRSKAKDKEWFVSQHQQLLVWAASMPPSIDSSLRGTITYVISRLQTRGASNRMLLEHLVLTYAARGRSGR